jgi:cell division protease FtsH
MEVESVDAEELKRILDENSPGPLVVPGTDVPLRLAPADGAPALDHAAPPAAEKKR